MGERSRGPQAECTIDMKPARALANASGYLGNRIEGTGVDVSGLRAKQNRSLNVCENRSKLIRSHAALIVGGNSDNSFASQTQHLQ